MFAARQLSLARPVAGRRLFHATAPTLVKVGDKLPNVELMENSPGNKVNIAEELKSGKGLIIGKPPVDADHIQDRSLINELLLIRYRI
jgi:2-Cys peroxiredoxin 5